MATSRTTVRYGAVASAGRVKTDDPQHPGLLLSAWI